MNQEDTTVIHRERGFEPITTAMILAGGLGKRMRPLTNNMPKPLVKVHGRCLIDHGLDALVRAGVSKVVINVHYLADMMEAHLAKRNDIEIIISDERDQLMDSGGGIAKALPHLGDKPFYLLNADSFWIEGYKPNLQSLSRQWNVSEMDFLLMLSSMCNSVGYNGKGDFQMGKSGRLTRREEREIAPFAYSGAAIVNPAIFEGAPREPFSLNLLFDKAIEEDRLYGMHMDGLWLHVGTPEAVHQAEEAIARSAA